MASQSLSYVAYAFSDQPGFTVITGRICFAGRNLRFESDAVTLEIPFVRLEIELGDKTDRRVYFRDPKLTEWTVYTFEEKVLKARPLHDQAHTRKQINEAQSAGELGRRLKITAACLAVFALIGLLVWILSGALVTAVLNRIPPRWETQLGDTVMSELRKQESFSADPTLSNRLHVAVAPLLASLPSDGSFQYRFYVIDDEDPNAFALPGGHVLVTTGLMNLASRSEEIAAVVAHEIAHVAQRHGIRRIISSAGPYLLLRLLIRDQEGLLGVISQGSELLVRQSFSQEYELQADGAGFGYLVRARVDPRALAEMLQKLEQAQRGQGQHPGIAALSTHPETRKRIEKLDAMWAKLEPKPSLLTYPHDEAWKDGPVVRP